MKYTNDSINKYINIKMTVLKEYEKDTGQVILFLLRLDKKFIIHT